MIMDAVKDHWVPHLSEKKTRKEMFDALVTKSENINKKMILQNKFKAIEMPKLDSVTSYLMKVMKIHEQLVVVGEKIKNVELVNIALNGFLISWEPFIKVICACGNLLKVVG